MAFQHQRYLCNKYRVRPQSFTNMKQIKGKIANTPPKNIFSNYSEIISKQESILVLAFFS